MLLVKQFTRWITGTLIVAALVFAWHDVAFGQEIQEVSEEPVAEAAAIEPNPTVNSVIDEGPFPLPRTAGMGGAISPVADDLDAALGNPAGIGGMRWGKAKLPWIRKLYFPRLGAAANNESQQLSEEVRSSNAMSDKEVGRAIVDAHGGKRQYARANIATGLVLGRTILLPFTDHQIAATARGQGSDLIDLRARSLTGAGFGFSATDPAESFALGYFGYGGQRSEAQGAFLYQDFTDRELAAKSLKEKQTNYTGSSHNAGLRFRLHKRWEPTLAIVGKDIGDSRWAAEAGKEDLVVKQDAVVGFSLSPPVGKTSHLHVVLEAFRLLDPDTSLTKKYRAGFEWSLGGFGSHATLALRGGVAQSGGSAGLQLNLGLIAIEAATEAVDIGAGNQKVIEQRYLGVFHVNVAEF